MMDGSLLEDAKTPATYEYNVEVTRKVVEMAHAGGVSVEGNWAASVHSKPVRRVRRTALVPKVSWIWISC